MMAHASSTVAASPPSPSPLPPHAGGEGVRGGIAAFPRPAERGEGQGEGRLDRAGLIEKARAVAAKLGKEQICRGEFVRATGIGDVRVRKYFKGWRDLFEAAGLQPHEQNVRVDDDRLLAALRDGFLARGRIAARTPARKIGAYGVAKYRKRWGPWNGVLAAFQEWIVRHDPAFPLLDQLALATGKTPDPAPRPSPARWRAPQWRSTGGRQYGEVLNFRGLQHAPVNEQGVVLLFGMMAAELGFIVEGVTTGYPDCEAKRRIATNPERWQRARIEFEWQSRNFLSHGHDPAGCDVVVCWEHNWPACPVEVVELKREVRRLSG